jgi:hypothetical protein
VVASVLSLVSFVAVQRIKIPESGAGRKPVIGDQ